MIPVLKVSLPNYQALQKYIIKIDSNSVYSNFGPLYHELNSSIASHYKIDSEQVCLLNSATSGLIAAIYTISQRLNKKPCELTVAVPAWSFVATAQAPMSLGCNIIFVDVDADGFASPSHSLVADLLIVVSPFGEPLNIDDWLQYQSSTGISILFDCAASFSTLLPSSIPAVVSCHATKGFSTGEGGYVACTDTDFIDSIRVFSNFGFTSSRSASVHGINLKLSEINCAYGLTILDHKCHYFQPFVDQISYYNSLLIQYSDLVRPFNSSFYRTTYNVKFTSSNYNRQEFLYIMLDKYGIECRSWWGNPLPLTFSKSTPFEFETLPFTNSTYLAENVIGLPLGSHVNTFIQRHVVKSLVSCLL